MEITPQEWEVCLSVLQRVSENPSLIDHNERAKALIAKIHSRGKKGQRRVAREERVASDRSLQERAAIVQARAQALSQAQAQDAPPALPAPDDERQTVPATLSRALTCYVCKRPFAELHFFYHRLCPSCAAFSFAKRSQRADLRGRFALVTGGRVKIGFQIALRLLRDGARVLVTTRFPRDAFSRFQTEPDFSDWAERLRVCGLDLRDIPVVEAFCGSLLAAGEPLDIVINNAAQTIKRPTDFYRHLLQAEHEAHEAQHAALPEAGAAAVQVLAGAERAGFDWKNGPGAFLLEKYLGKTDSPSAHFPPGHLDSDNQQIDTRPRNSWRLRLEEVGSAEMLESLLVNTVAPFVLNARLVPLMKLSEHARRFIVNVSAVEGQFERASKTGLHPHTNMAKAALNMMTRTSAQDLAREGIFMNSVDPGWMSDQNPHPVAAHLREQHGFYPPLDAIDSAARIYDPIARGINEPDEPLHGHFLKDFRPQPW